MKNFFLFIIFTTILGLLISCGQGLEERKDQPQPVTMDFKMLYQMMLEWAVLNKPLPGQTSEIFFPSPSLIKDEPVIRVSSENLLPEVKFYLPNRQVQVLTEKELQKVANEIGDFLAFRFSELKATGASVELGLAMNWIAAENSQEAYLSGGEVRLLFRWEDGTWKFREQLSFQIS